MQPDRILIYVLLAGLMVWEDSVCSLITCEGLDWRRTLAVLLWYVVPPSATIEELLVDYKRGFQVSEHNLFILDIGSLLIHRMTTLVLVLHFLCIVLLTLRLKTQQKSMTLASTCCSSTVTENTVWNSLWLPQAQHHTNWTTGLG